MLSDLVIFLILFLFLFCIVFFKCVLILDVVELLFIVEGVVLEVGLDEFLFVIEVGDILMFVLLCINDKISFLSLLMWFCILFGVGLFWFWFFLCDVGVV